MQFKTANTKSKRKCIKDDMEGKLSHRPYQFRSERLCDRDFHAEMLSGEAV